ncbi:DUF1758 domain-containing protein [Trichonephila clavipes]|uniref:DUF1758 domain-containing protein n=1 Tax=Trichonephila clavipes TaxID=2585209 RepID=A0A8X6VA40_TRICX|nr:DUF1758 domain-containing protein [Trichonephila clavipes]
MIFVHGINNGRTYERDEERALLVGGIRPLFLHSRPHKDLIRVVEDLDGTVESTDTIAKLKTKIEKSSTFESDPDFVKTLIKNCIDEREELNDYEKLKSIVLREFQVTPRECLNSFKNAVKSSGETYIQFAARLTANFQYYCSLRKVNSFESLRDLLISDKLFETLNKETATHIGIREAEDWFRPIDLAKECDIYISARSGSLLCKKVNGAMKTSSVDSNSRSPTPSPMKSKHRRFSSGLHGSTAADSVQSGWPDVGSNRSRENNAVFARRRS